MGRGLSPHPSRCLGKLLLLMALALTYVSAAEPATSQEVTTWLSWDGGTLTAKQAERWLSDSGNPTEILTHSTDARDIDFQAGTYWQAVVAVCTAFELAPDSPGQHLRFHLQAPPGGTHILSPGLGMVTLRERDDPRVRNPPLPARIYAVGPLLIEVLGAEIRHASLPHRTRSGAWVSYRSRLEPRTSSEAVGSVIAHWSPLLWSDGTVMEWPDGHGGHPIRHGSRSLLGHRMHSPPPAMVLTGASAHTPAEGFSIHGQLEIIFTEVAETTIAIAGSEEQRIAMGPNGEAWYVIQDAEHLRQGGRTTISLTIPGGSTSVGRASCQLIDAEGSVVLSTGSSMRLSNDGSHLHSFVFPETAEPFQVRISASFVRHRSEHGISDSFQFPAGEGSAAP